MQTHAAQASPPATIRQHRAIAASLSIGGARLGGWSEAIYLKPGVRLLRLPEGVAPETYIAGGCGLPTAFHAIERHLKQEQRWRELEAAYRAMLDRLPDESDPSVFVTLLDKLARVNIEHLADREAAREALNLAVQLDPTNEQRKALLARF